MAKKYFLMGFLFPFVLNATDEIKKPEGQEKKPVAEELFERPEFGKVCFVNQRPESILTYDSASKTYKPKFAFMINKNKETTFLATQKVEAGSYQYAFFVEHSSIFKKEPSFTVEDFDLLLYDDGTYRIQSNHGETSFLAVPPVSDGSYQYAIFATEEYIAKNNCQSRFKVIAQDGTNHKDFLIETAGENSVSLVLNPVASGSYEYPYFSGYDYAAGQTGSSMVFDINTAR